MKTKFIILISLILVAITIFWAQSNETKLRPELPKEVKEWEQKAEQGDTSALHKLLVFLDTNSPVYLEVEEVIEAIEVDEEGNEIEAVEDSIFSEDENVSDSDSSVIDSATAEFYNSRLEFWLTKGLQINDPVANYIKGMRTYYTNESEAITYLAKAAELGNNQAALFCGSACYNQGHIDEAIKYLTIAYNNNVPSAGWHLAMCYVHKGDDADIENAVKYLKHSAALNCPEAVLEMKRIEPDNPVWKHKTDSLNISFQNFKIIP